MGVYNAGQVLTGAMLNGLTQEYSAVGTTLSVTATTGTDIPSASVTFTTEGSNGSYCVVKHVSDISRTVTAGNNLMQIFVVVDGVVTGSETIADDRVSRSSVAGSGGGKISLSAGSHTVKLQANRVVAAGTFTINDSFLEVRVVDLF